MARIYQPREPQVALQGPKESAGFQPVQAFDPSRQILSEADRRLAQAAQAGENMLRTSARDLESLTQFSDTLNKFLFDQAERKNEQDLKLGIADILNGDVTVNPGAFDQFQEAAGFLEDKAFEESQLVETVAEVSPALANQARFSSPAISGWRAYGQAIGRTKKAAAFAQIMLQEFMQSDEPIVPITRPDGTVDLISPREAGYSGDMAEIGAAQQVGIQQLINQSGIQGINPVILAEHLTPTVMNVQAAIASNRAAEVRKYKKEEAIELAKGDMSAAIATLDYNDPNAVQDFWQKYTRNLATHGHMGLGEANKTVAESIVADARALRNKQILEAFAPTPLIANQPNGVTVGERFRSLFETASREMDGYEESERTRLQKQEDDYVDDVLSANNLVLATPGATKEQIAQSFAVTTEQLRSIASPKSLNALLQLEQRGQNYNPLMAGMLQQDIAAGVQHSAASINRLRVEGVINSEEEARLLKSLPSSAAAEKVNGMKSEILTQARGQMKFVLDSQGISQSDGASITEAFANQMATETMAKLNNMIIANPSMSDAEMRQFYVAEMQALSRQPRFIPEIDTNGQIKVPNLEPQARVLSFRNPTTGQMVRDMSQAPAAVVQSTRANAVRDFLVNPQELTQNAQAFIQGGQPTPRVRALMSITGKDWQTFLRDQHQVRGLPFTNMSQAQASQAAQQRRALAPAAASILINPNATPQQRINAWNDINAARLRQQRAAEERRFGGDSSPVDYQAAYDALVGKESGGDPLALNRSGSGATGLGQVMPNNIGPWTEKWLGRRMTQDEFRRNPEAQRRVVMSQFRQNINDQLAAGYSPEIALRRAAAVWYSGNAENHTSTKRETYNGTPYPSVKEYADDIVRRYTSNRQSFSGARGGRANFTPRNVQSIRIETPGPNFQPGLDLWFADKNFGAVLPGRVKEIRMNNGNYGNMLVVESTSPLTGEKVDVLYSHFDRINVREGQRISPGMVLGRQGGTGRVNSVDGTIASIDFLAPAPKGSNAMTPYRRWKQLAERIKSQIESGTFR